MFADSQALMSSYHERTAVIDVKNVFAVFNVFYFVNVFLIFF